jgi:uncharacterized protein YndB with AHSA1/START domain
MTDVNHHARREFTLVWTLDASPDEVFRAWTDPEQLGWFFNDSQPAPEEPIEVDLTVGGAWRQRMVLDEQTSYTTGGIYREIVPGERLVYSWGAEGGWPDLDPDNLDQSPLITVVLDGAGAGTEMTVHVLLPEAFVAVTPPVWLEHVETGMRDTVDRLAAALAAASATA